MDKSNAQGQMPCEAGFAGHIVRHFTFMEADEQKISHALSMWANHIETGDICVSAEDAIKRGMKTKPLRGDQMRFVLRLRELARAALQGKLPLYQ